MRYYAGGGPDPRPEDPVPPQPRIYTAEERDRFEPPACQHGRRAEVEWFDVVGYESTSPLGFVPGLCTCPPECDDAGEP